MRAKVAAVGVKDLLDVDILTDTEGLLEEAEVLDRHADAWSRNVVVYAVLLLRDLFDV